MSKKLIDKIKMESEACFQMKWKSSQDLDVPYV